MAAFDHNHIVAIRKQKIAEDKQTKLVVARAEVMREEMIKFRARLVKSGATPEDVEFIVRTFETKNAGAARAVLKKEVAAYFKSDDAKGK